MEFKLELLLDKRRLDVWRAFDNPDNLLSWQPTLKSVRHIQGTPGHEGAVTVLTYVESGREVVFEQVIIEREAPQRFSTTSNGVRMSNKVVNTFTSDGATRTRWELEASYRFRGWRRLLSPLLRGSVSKRTLAEMQRFKTFVEDTQPTSTSSRG